MTPKPPLISRLYRRLLRLYPRAFREQLGESMAQTFDDQLNADRPRSMLGRLGYVASLFAETGAGIGKEHALLIKERWMKTARFAATGTAAAIGLLLVLPFVILEYANNLRHDPLALIRANLLGLALLFGLLWLLPALFVLILMPMLRTVRAGNTLLASPASLVLKVGALLVLACLWGSLVLDQLPCFLGVPNCD